MASVESRLDCSVLISVCAGGLGEYKRGTCVFPRGYSLTGEYQVVINLSFLGSSHTVFSCFYKHKEQLPKASVLYQTFAEPGLAGQAVFLNAHLEYRDIDLLVNQQLTVVSVHE